MLVDIIYLLLWLILSMVVVFIKNIYILIGGLLILGLMAFLMKCSLIDLMRVAMVLLPLFILNILFTNLNNALLVIMRLFIMYLLASVTIAKIGIYNLALIISLMFKSKNLYIIVSLTLSFVPIMQKELSDIKSSLIAKGFTFNLQSILKNPKVLFLTFFTNLFIRVFSLEKVIVSKGY